MVLLLDIGNSNTHLGLLGTKGLIKQTNVSTRVWETPLGKERLAAFVKSSQLAGIAVCSVVPTTTLLLKENILNQYKSPLFELTFRTVTGVGINYPRPETIGPDRLANAIAVHKLYGAPSLVVDFGTAVTFDVVDRAGDYVGGIIAPGLAAMTEYLHEKTALLPCIKIKEVSAVIGKNTEQAMLIGAVHGYRGLVRELIMELKKELKSKDLPVVATGGYAELIAAKMPEILAVKPNLTLEGLSLAWYSYQENLLVKLPVARRTLRLSAEKIQDKQSRNVLTE